MRFETMMFLLGLMSFPFLEFNPMIRQASADIAYPTTDPSPVTPPPSPAPALVISSLSTVFAYPGLSVTITGSNFLGVDLVTFNLVRAASFTVVSSTEIRAVFPSGVIGRGRVRVRGFGGVTVPSASDIIPFSSSVSSGPNRTCAITTKGDLYCWGNNMSGEIGFGLAPIVDKPVKLGSGYAQVSLGRFHNCALTIARGELKCWGASNSYAQFGNHLMGSAKYPVSLGLGYIKVAAGGHHSCALANNGALKCWGRNDFGQVGVRSAAIGMIFEPTTVGIGYVDISLGYQHTCGITTASELKCWGSNQSGQLGDGTLASKTTPTLIGTGFSRISSGYSHTCAISNLSGELKCWGDNAFGQIGDNSLGAARLYPESIGYRFLDVSAGFRSTCAVNDSFQLWCWGDNSAGQIGDGTTSRRMMPVEIMVDANGNRHDYGSLAVGEFHACARSIDNYLFCWGRNNYGQVGIGQSLLPIFSKPMPVLKLESPVTYFGSAPLPTPAPPPPSPTPISAPTISVLQPSSAAEGTIIQINGSNFIGTNLVTFNLIPSPIFWIKSSTQISAIVPPGSASGKFRVRTTGGTAESATDFTVLVPTPTPSSTPTPTPKPSPTPVPAPSITGFTPLSGYPGSIITVTGAGFFGATSTSVNEIGSSFTIISDSQIKITVPVGSNVGYVRVRTPGGLATSAPKFTTLVPTPTPVPTPKPTTTPSPTTPTQ